MKSPYDMTPDPLGDLGIDEDLKKYGAVLKTKIEREDENHAYELEAWQNENGLIFCRANMFCPCCGGPKSVLEPVYDPDAWVAPSWATAAEELEFRASLRQLYESA